MNIHQNSNKLCQHFTSLFIDKIKLFINKAQFKCSIHPKSQFQQLQLCLLCGKTFCQKTSCSYQHYVNNYKTHNIMIHISTSHIYCFSCQNHIHQLIHNQISNNDFDNDKKQSQQTNRIKINIKNINVDKISNKYNKNSYQSQKQSKSQTFQQKITKTYDLLEKINNLIQQRSISLAVSEDQNKKTNSKIISNKNIFKQSFSNNKYKDKDKSILHNSNLKNQAKKQTKYINIQFNHQSQQKIQNPYSNHSQLPYQKIIIPSIPASISKQNNIPTVTKKINNLPKTQNLKLEIDLNKQLKKYNDYQNSITQSHLSKSLKTFGLANIGNTCYFNSILQCIYAIPQIHQFYSNFQNAIANHQKFIIQNVGFKNHQNLLLSFEQQQNQFNGHCKPTSQLNIIFKKFLKNKEPLFCPRNLFAGICKNKPSFRNMGQQDAQQLYGLLINSLIDSEKNARNITKDFEKAIIQNKGNVHFTTIQKMFGFYLGSRLFCQQCSKISWTFDFALDLSIQISKNSSLYKKQDFDNIFNEQVPQQQLKGSVNQNKCLFYPDKKIGQNSNFIDNFFKAEQFTNKNFYKCQRCKSSKSIRKLYIKNQPEILMIGLKRFNNNGSKNNLIVKIPEIIDLRSHVLKQKDNPQQKIQKKQKQQCVKLKKQKEQIQKMQQIRQQSESFTNTHQQYLNLKKQQEIPQKQQQIQQKSQEIIYEIIGGVVHGGTSMGGHYVAYTRRSSQWYYFSDSHVKPSSWQKVKLAQPYLLFYRKIK